jgi:hypothetical protein
MLVRCCFIACFYIVLALDHDPTARLDQSVSTVCIVPSTYVDCHLSTVCPRPGPEACTRTRDYGCMTEPYGIRSPQTFTLHAARRAVRSAVPVARLWSTDSTQQTIGNQRAVISNMLIVINASGTPRSLRAILLSVSDQRVRGWRDEKGASPW